MSEINRVELLGNLGQDPDRRQVGESAKLQFSVCTTEKYMKNGQQAEVSEWHNVELWGPSVEWVAPLLKKGAKVHVLGSLKTEEYTNKEGQKVRRTIIKASRVLPIARGEGGPRPPPKSERHGLQPNSSDYGNATDDIPF